MSAIFDLADRYVTAAAGLDAFLATMLGVPGHEEAMTDYSPDGVDAGAALTRRTLEELGRTEAASDADRVCREFMLDRLQIDIQMHDAGEPWRLLRNIGSPVSSIRMIFDLCPQASADDWGHIAARLAKVPASIDGLEATLRHGLELGLPAARRQALVCAKQAAVWGGVEGDGTPFFVALAERCPHQALRADVNAAARAATDAYAGLARFLRNDYAPAVPDHDPVGRDRYRLAARHYLGSDVDLDETYVWGWEELRRLDAEMRRVAERISPGATVEKVIELLTTDPARAVTGTDNLPRFLQNLTDTAIAELNGTHFDIPEQMRRCECMIAPPGGAAAMYYTPPSEDWSRPGRTWYPDTGRTVFPVWSEVSTAYHEGVPGHHLQLGLVAGLTSLSRYQRTLGFVSGHGEGWALYAERLMGELGYLDNPDYEMGMLASHIFRAMRVVVDIGLHLEKTIPDGEPNAGQTWSWDNAIPFADRYSPIRGDFTRSEVERYLGMPAQAISYKVGERAWLEMRDDVRRRQGTDFDLKAFHTQALQLGSLGLDQMRREMSAAELSRAT
ncbi:MAG: DUF885 domain-containing protein [Candidatus Dormibacteria bacterium]